ncbi:MAG: ankyrin repeat domain-containing protein [Armatimonadota bacterium]
MKKLIVFLLLCILGVYGIWSIVLHNREASMLKSAGEGNFGDVYGLLDKHPNLVNASDNSGYTPLLNAILGHHADMATYLIGKRADVNAKDKFGHTPFSLSFAQYINDKRDGKPGDMKLLKLLIENGADINVKGIDDETPLHMAARTNQNDAARLLIDNGADTNALDSKHQTPLLLVLSNNNETLAEILIEKGADVKASDEDGKTALLLASGKGNPGIISLLISKGGDINAKDNNGYTPLLVSIKNGNIDIVELLIEKGADVKVKNKDGNTPLHYAAYGVLCDTDVSFKEEKITTQNTYKNNPSLVLQLIDKGADINASNAIGETPLHNAAKIGFNNIITIFVLNGAEIDARTAKGDTPIDVARKNGRDNIVSLLKIIKKNGNEGAIYLAR